MTHSSRYQGLYCTASGNKLSTLSTGPTESGGRREPEYETTQLGWKDGELADHVNSMWRYAEALPFCTPVTAGEGRTPLIKTETLAADCGVNDLIIKDESRNPTGSVFDRGLSAAVTAAKASGAELVASAGAGNSAQSAAAYASKAGLRSYEFVPSRAPFSNKAMINVHGGEMKVIGGRYSDAKAAAQSELQTDWYTLQERDNPFRHDAYKTIAFEIAEAHNWTVPDAVVVPTASGELLAGIAKGFDCLLETGQIVTQPRLFGVQASGCAPLVGASAESISTCQTPDTIIGELEIPAPPLGHAAVTAATESGGSIISVDDDVILEAAVQAAQSVALQVGAAGGAAIAGCEALREMGELSASAQVVAINTESGMQTADILRSHLMGKGI
jgi:threonine synthase